MTKDKKDCDVGKCKYTHRRLLKRFDPEEYILHWPSNPFESGNEFNNPYEHIRSYLRRVGIEVHEDNWNYPNLLMLTKWGAFHLSGATVTVDFVHYVSEWIDWDTNPTTISADIKIDIYSQRPTDDIIAKLKKRFPYLEEDM